MLNAVQAATRLTSLSNLVDVPTDCPTRERAGWTGDGGLTREVTSFNFDMGAFYSKWITDIADAQQTFRTQCMSNAKQCDCVGFNCTGEVPPAAPWYNHGYHGSPTLPGTDPGEHVASPRAGVPRLVIFRRVLVVSPFILFPPCYIICAWLFACAWLCVCARLLVWRQRGGWR